MVGKDSHPLPSLRAADVQIIPQESDCQDNLGVQCADRAAQQPLDLIEAHLRTTPYLPASRGLPDGMDIKGWERPNVPGWCASEDGNLVLKVQRFNSGGYEAVMRPINLPKLARMMDAPRHRGKREAPSELNPEHARKNAARAKREVRLACKNIGADRLMTLTRRETDPSTFWSRDDWAAGWKKLLKMLKRAGVELIYVGVLEQHKKGNFHLHVALTGHVRVDLVRRIWWVCCGGRGMGNVDLERRRTHDKLHRTAKIASYIAKQFETSEFNKKRYWSSRQSLPDVRRIILRAENLNDGLREFTEYFGLDLFRLLKSKYEFFAFPDGSGFWMSYHPDLVPDPPF